LACCENEPKKKEAKDEDARRKALWAALEKAKPRDIEKIDTYCENPSLTQVFFTANGDLYLFTLKDETVTNVVFMRVFFTNRITFALNDKGLGAWLLWYNGTVQMVVAGEK
jgi:hypothetical protein